MWRPWGRSKSTVKIYDTSLPSLSSSPFSCSTFKDIQQLCVDDPTITTTTSSSSSSSSFNNNSNNRKKPPTASVFHRVRLANSLLRAWSKPETDTQKANSTSSPTTTAETETEQRQQQKPKISIPGADKRIVIYFTSLRVVRPTFEDCRAVRSILRGFRVSIDERDLSMDSSFLTELQGILPPHLLGQSNNGKLTLTLPRVFIGGRYMGGAEEIKQLHETGELKKFVEGLPAAEPGTCDTCGGHGFILCDECNGSHKLYAEKSGGFKTCTACNENGLVRCPSCCSCEPL